MAFWRPVRTSASLIGFFSGSVIDEKLYVRNTID